MTLFDVDEYLHLALHASSMSEHHACMTYLKEALRLEPQHPTAIFLLAVQHAELGLRQRAIKGMRAALELKPDLDIARLQLGLLLIDAGEPEAARQSFALLGGSADKQLRLYAEGLCAICDGNASLARTRIEQGLAHESGNTALSALMRRILTGPEMTGKSAAAAVEPDSGQADVLLGAYGRPAR